MDRIQDYFLDKGQVYLSRLYQALLATGYYGLLRMGELTSGMHPIKAYNVFLVRHKKKFQIVLQSSKTHPEADLPKKVTIIRTEGTDSALMTSCAHCPFEILHQYIWDRGTCKTVNDPFFIFKDGSQCDQDI